MIRKEQLAFSSNEDFQGRSGHRNTTAGRSEAPLRLDSEKRNFLSGSLSSLKMCRRTISRIRTWPSDC